MKQNISNNRRRIMIIVKIIIVKIVIVKMMIIIERMIIKMMNKVNNISLFALNRIIKVKK
jgi:hypothetical protein